jgi:alpha-galactosidase
VAVDVRAPEGWTVTATTASRRHRLGTDAPLGTTWTVVVPEGTAAGSYPLTVTTAYTWGPRRRAGTSTAELVTAVVTAPADGRRHLSGVAMVSATNARGPVELDQSNGGDAPADGTLITIGGRVYTHGLGTTAPSEIRYFLGGRCTELTVDVGIDDDAPTAVPATFTVYADDAVAAESGPVASGDAPRTLTADLTGAQWLRLVTTGSGTNSDGTAVNDHTDWARPVLTCGAAGPDDPVLPAERTLFSFESGDEGFTIANPADGGSVARSAEFHTDGAYGLAVTTPVTGNWYGRTFDQPLDLRGTTMLKFDVHAAETGTVGEIAVQVGDDFTWCQGGRWAWTNPHTSRTMTTEYAHMSCPAGTTVDPSRIRAIWVFLNGVHVHIDNIRAA